MKTWPDVSNDLWIIREWFMERHWRGASPDAQERMLADRLDDEQAGYELPDGYTAGPRLHVFASDDCEVWLGCLNADLVSPQKTCRLISNLISDLNMACAVDLDGPLVVALDGRRVIAWYQSEVRHGTADAE